MSSYVSTIKDLWLNAARFAFLVEKLSFSPSQIFYISDLKLKCSQTKWRQRPCLRNATEKRYKKIPKRIKKKPTPTKKWKKRAFVHFFNK
jgi:hypothetical protein